MKFKHIVLIVIIAVIGIALYLFLTFCDIYSVKAVAVEAGSFVDESEVINRLDFGEVPQGEQVAKTVVLENTGDNDHSIKIWIIGSIAQEMDVQPGMSFELEAGTSQDVNFIFTMPDSAKEDQKFSGRVILVELP